MKCKFDYNRVYFAGMQRAAGEYLKQSSKAARRPFAIRTVWYGVWYFNTCAIDGTRDELEELYALQDALAGLMCELSPADIVRAFPPTKGRKGTMAQWAGWGGYTSTMQAARLSGYTDCLEKCGRVRSLLWGYRNIDIERFNAKCQELTESMGKFCRLSE